MADWYVENLRLSFLGVIGWTQRPVFAELIGIQPDQLTAQPPLHLHQEVGTFEDAQVTIVQQADRFDIVLSDRPTRNTVNADAPDFRPLYWVGPFDESINKFDSLCSKATKLISKATRLAFALTLIHETKDALESTAYLRTYLPTIKLNPDNDIDLSFQINRRVRNTEYGMINRLARWDVINLNTIQFTPSFPFAAPLPSKPPVFAARVYIDISTEAENSEAFIDLPAVVQVLRTYGTTIAEHGDRR